MYFFNTKKIYNDNELLIPDIMLRYIVGRDGGHV